MYQQQVDTGRRALFEHPKSSRLWTYPEVRALMEQHHVITCDMCRFGLRVPRCKKLIRKSTQLMVTHEEMKTLAKRCPGSQHVKHQCHQVVAGSDPVVGSTSTFAGKYKFVEAVMDTLPSYAALKNQCLAVCHDWTCRQEHEVLAAKPELSDSKTDEELMKVIDKVHRNLGHLPGSDLIRILKHAHAADRAIQLARKHECEFCKSQIRPHVPLPAKSSRPQEFNQAVGIDVKNLQGWLPNQKIKAVNIVDQASCYQLMIPFHCRETSAVIRQAFADHWVRIFGPPKEVILDQAQTNMGEEFQQYLESLGCHVHPIAAEAHWQLGRTESHGGWFSRVLDRTLAEALPKTKEAWEECVTHAHVKNSMIQSYGYTPHQYVFGKNPQVPTDLMNEPLHVVPATLGLSDEAIEKSKRVRAAARHAVITTQDDQALRRAFSARPRLIQQFHPGDLVAYWRSQKVQQGKLVQGGRWYGTAVVIGNIGKNYVVAHRRQIFRVAPEQLRSATSEEKALVTTPQAELLGVRDLLEGGTFRSHLYIDLVPSHYPPVASDSDRHSEDDPAPAPVVPEAGPCPLPPVASPPDGQGDIEAVPPESEDVVPQSSSGSREGPVLHSNVAVPNQDAAPSYGPIRRRIVTKTGPDALHRPPAMREQDFVDMIREVVPQLLQEVTADSTMSSPNKRAPEFRAASEEPPSSRARTEEALSGVSIGSRARLS